MTYQFTNAARNASFSGSPSSLLDWTIRTIAEWLRRRSIRASLGSLSADKLRDMGLTRCDLDEVLAMTLSGDASEKLRELAAKRSGNW